MEESSHEDPLFELDVQQAEAVALGCDIKRRIVGITGAAGSGKTTIMRLMHKHLTDSGYRVAAAAPTGKAAKRIHEATGIPALTIHRLLEYSHPGERHPKTGKVMGLSAPKRDRENPLPFDVVLADEYAMVNREIHTNLIDALPAGGCIRCFGDVNQLSPIEEGHVQQRQGRKEPSPFEFVLSKFPSVRLETNHRQGEGSGVVENALLLLGGRMLKRRDDLRLIITDEPVKRLSDFVLDAQENDIDYRLLSNQIITSTRVRWTGTLALNAMLQRVFHDDEKPFFELPRHTWDTEKAVVCRVQVGNKVIIVQNIHALEVYNGETGIITEITEYGEIAVDFGDREILIPPEIQFETQDGKVRVFDPRKDIELAYAVTTHKCQGSEYDHIVYVLNKSTVFMQSRVNTYTAITRARKTASLITDQQSLSACIRPEKNR